MIVLLSDAAERDLLEGVHFYDRHGRDVGSHFLNSLMDDLRSLAVLAGVHGKRHGYHCMGSKRFPYAIYYLVTGEEVRVVAILDERRNPAWIARRLRRG